MRTYPFLRISLAVALPFVLLLAPACTPSAEQLQALSAGSIGCPQNEITISHEEKIGLDTSSWQADCRDRSFVCGRAGFETINCTAMLPPGAQTAAASSTLTAAPAAASSPIAVAPGTPAAPPPAAAPPAPPPPPPPEEVTKACAEAEDYDKRAAKAVSPAKEQLLKIAAHKHRDCDDGRAPAPPRPAAPAAAPASVPLAP